MISPEELKKKALRPWATGAFLKSRLAGESLFPLTISPGAPSGKTLSRNFTDVRHWIRMLEKGALPVNDYGYVIDYRTVNDRMLGPQQVPRQIVFEREENWLRFIGKQADFRRFQQLADETRQQLPDLVPFLAEKPLTVLKHQKEWSRLLAICAWFLRHRRPGLYLRQLDIPGIDTKFIETRKKILTLLLDRVLGREAVDESASGPAGHGFERRYGLLYDPPMVRLRILDAALAVNGLADLSLPAADAASTDFGAATVFITENKINGLCFPPVPGALIIFGLGYGVEMLSEFSSLKDAAIYYWGDIDTHGFSILSRLRRLFPQTRSLLMDEETLRAHKHLWGTEAADKRFAGHLPNLTSAEDDLFTGLKEDRWGNRIRLEQERIPYSRLMQCLKTKGLNWR